MIRMKIVLVAFLITILVACVTPYPQKDFVSELWFIDPSSLTISWENDEGEIIIQKFEELDPRIWVVIKLEHIEKEWKYQSELIKSCETWR